jgi:hypothetical protein
MEEETVNYFKALFRFQPGENEENHAPAHAHSIVPISTPATVHIIFVEVLSDAFEADTVFVGVYSLSLRQDSHHNNL